MEGHFVSVTMPKTVGRQEPLIGGIQCRSHADCPSKEHTKQVTLKYPLAYEASVGTGGIPRPIFGRMAKNRSPKLATGTIWERLQVLALPELVHPLQTQDGAFERQTMSSRP